MESEPDWVVVGMDATNPQACTSILWTAPAARVLVNGHPVLTATSSAQCLSAELVPRTPIALHAQPRVLAR